MIVFSICTFKIIKKNIFRIATPYRHYHFNEHQYHSKSHRLYISGTNEITSECGRPHRSSWFRFSISSLDCHLQSYSKNTLSSKSIRSNMIVHAFNPQNWKSYCIPTLTRYIPVNWK